MINKIIWSCPVPPGKQGGPFTVLNNIRIALEKHYNDKLTIMSGEGMPYEAAHTLAAGSLFDELASFQLEGEYDLFFGVGYDSLLQIREIKNRGLIRLLDRSDRVSELLLKNSNFTNVQLDTFLPKAVTIHMSTEHNHAYNVLTPEYQKYGIKNEPLPPLLRWRGDREHELVDGIIVASNQQRETYEATPRLVGKVHVVGFGVDSKLFHPPQVPTDESKVLIAGGNAVRKGLTYLLRAWNDAHLDGILTIMGSDVRLNPSWRTRVLGWVPDEKVPEVYRQNSVFCLPSIEEGQALTILEAMASGLPVIVTRETGATDFVKDGTHGLVIPSRDTTAIQNALQYFHDNPAEIKRMGKNARELAESLSWEKFQQQLIQTLEAI